jgi:hypothetical protein
VRLHGKGRVVPPDTPEFGEIGRRFARSSDTGARSIVVVDVNRVSDSCGYAVPLMDFRSHRTTFDEWTERKGRDGIRSYWVEKNSKSIDGLDGLPLSAGWSGPE